MAQFNPYYVGKPLTEIIERLEKIAINEEEKEISAEKAHEEREKIYGEFLLPGNDLHRLLFISLLNIASEAEDEIVFSATSLSFYKITADHLDDLAHEMKFNGFRVDGRVKPQLIVEMYSNKWQIEGYYPNGRDFRGVYFTR